tara:strand:+ start:296 stop:667 length:372 start_codon:yes stop_codon:yes gene_type:complete
MALEGKYIWKGVEINDAYIVIQNTNCSVNYPIVNSLKSEATYNEDGTVKDEAVYESNVTKEIIGSYTANVYKDKNTRNTEPEQVIASVYGTYTPKHTASAKNEVAQAYAHLKTTDACKDLADA